MSVFRFKQFEVRQDLTPMKVGTDGVLLGAWVSVRPADRRILDVGTGTGLIALMLAQRAPQAQVTGIDVEAVDEACANAAASPWAGRLRMVRSAVQEFVPEERFDLIVSNPPFFTGSLTCPDAGRTTARHAVRLPFAELRDAAARLLNPGGRFAVVLPADVAGRFIALCFGRFFLMRRTDVRTAPRRPVKRVLLEFGISATAGGEVPSVSSAGGSAVADGVPECSELVVGTGGHESYTPEYRALTRDFYLKF